MNRTISTWLVTLGVALLAGHASQVVDVHAAATQAAVARTPAREAPPTSAKTSKGRLAGPVNGKPVIPPPTTAPTGLSAQLVDAKVVLNWNAVANATSYAVFRTLDDTTWPATPYATSPQNRFRDRNVVNGRTYFYKVAGVNRGGMGPLSVSVSATPIPPPAAPTGVSAVAGNASAMLSWNAATGATSYNVYRSTTAGGQGATPHEPGVTGTTFTDVNLTNGQAYYYRITAVGAGGEGARSAEVSATPVEPPVVDLDTLATHRFLRQATWGPKPGDIDAVKAMGRDAFLTQQFAAPMSVYPDTLFDLSVEFAQEHFMGLALNGEDQLRQRMAWALHKIWVVSAVEVPSSRGIVTYHRLLLSGAFGSYRDLMEDVTLNPAMGRYLNMLNNKSQARTGLPPNENYARELMQLFTLGLVQLTPGGVPTNPAAPAPTYSEDDVKALAKILTGWTFGDGNPATIPTGTGATNYGVPMEPVAAWHDTTAKTFLGEDFPVGVGATAELDHALDVIFAQATLAPFVSRQLIQQLVTSNPSQAYVSEVAGVFSGTGGNLAEVARAILTHPEATTTTTTGGKLAEPVLYITSMMRAFDASVTDHPFMTNYSESMGQRVFYPPSVFSYFSPNFKVAGTNNGFGVPLTGPEFQGLTTVTTLERANFVGGLLGGHYGSNVTIDYSPFMTRARNAAALVDFCALTFMGGRISPEHRSEIINAVTTTPEANEFERAGTAIYLTLTVAQAQVDR